ncbi:hypothetical protein ACQKDA_09190 [Psychrobacter sp. NPDC078370]|uniref:hypothetical protein n=1 Tax=unclassified Psychrobacter TaxID=196806 RepID=UPI00086C865C|nr:MULTISPECIES: hypothetical protein [unclassified Psychrobacter]OEH66863.1 MAG: hypothetical protein BAX61_07650 [Psychrobacter sp. B29-1]PKG67677.1 hypothetical protein CXF56_01790 [Psychrobacter sp. Choline-02u-13]PKH48124.1 hypothetical protein CXF69_13835 [Psychrobacter sp. Choline-02u-9]PLT21164.1 hypothetical protein CXF62_11740 [Psychrobacter sp. MES7-P7E]TEW85999.1 hypothetical protein E2545_07750 [Psychrobacter sp. 230]|tara:strand:+ start:213 stop:1151 length:939 start_codon:yes stop_codon:yes gene_type:complete
MSVANISLSKWHKVAGIGLVCGLALAGCDRSDKEDTTEQAELTEQETVDAENSVAPAISCDDPMVQDRLKSALKNTLNQQAQSLAANYANDAEISLANGVVSEKTNGVVIDVQNAAILQQANENGMTTCQASVSMTLPSEDLYQASQVQAANNQPSLQSRLAQDNIRINNNMLVDDAFTYIVGTQGGQVRTRIAGQPALITVVADVMAGSVFKTAMDEQRAQRAAERRATQNNDTTQTAPIRQPRTVTPVEPIRPTEPTPPPTINKPAESQNSSTANTQAAAAEPSKPATPKAVPKDETIDMVIIEDNSATY